LGANSTIVCGITVGRWAFVAAGSVVTKDVPDYALVMGVPGKISGWVCECGASLKFIGGLSLCSCGRQYQQVTETHVEKQG
jgi:UDP-2-acetamido-3-amino-2,3-dideoxy-glucuronate N-acetyltransferase